VVKYFVARLVLFLVCAAVLALIGAGPLAALVGALFVSLLLSYVLLRRLRDAATVVVADRMQSRMERRAAPLDEDALIEDAQVDQALREDGHRDDALPEGDRRV
jgi:hypothetical protein